jgi:hypothetical protein
MRTLKVIELLGRRNLFPFPKEKKRKEKKRKEKKRKEKKRKEKHILLIKCSFQQDTTRSATDGSVLAISNNYFHDRAISNSPCRQSL